MKTPQYLQDEIQAIDPSNKFKLFIIYNIDINRWQVRKWLIQFPQKHDYYSPSGGNWRFKSELCQTVCQENEYDQDIGYKDIDMRVIHAWQESTDIILNRKKQFAQEIDKKNQDLEESADREFDYQARAVAKNIYKYYREPSIFLGSN